MTTDEIIVTKDGTRKIVLINAFIQNVERKNVFFTKWFIYLLYLILINMMYIVINTIISNCFDVDYIRKLHLA